MTGAPPPSAVVVFVTKAFLFSAVLSSVSRCLEKSLSSGSLILHLPILVNAFSVPWQRTQLSPLKHRALASRRNAATLSPEPLPATGGRKRKGKRKRSEKNPTDKQDNRTPQKPLGKVEVFDGVFSPEVCLELHELAIDHSERTTGDFDEESGYEEDGIMDGSSIFVHKKGRSRSENDCQLTPLEQALDSFLTAYYRDNAGDCRNDDIVVEYWCRQEHLHLGCHLDVDETWFERCEKMPSHHHRESFRTPTFGHVLYLTPPTEGLGPTVVFPPTTSKSNCTTDIRDETDAVVTVPAVPGRVLRFPGNALHGVPKPAEVWFSPEAAHTEEDLDDPPPEDCDDEDCDDDERSVVLFNVWEKPDDDESSEREDDLPIGPVAATLDPMFHGSRSNAAVVDMMMSSNDPIMGEGATVDASFLRGLVQEARKRKKQLLRRWRKKYAAARPPRSSNSSSLETNDKTKKSTAPVVYSGVHCAPKDSWKSTTVRSEATDPTTVGSIKIPLMGDAKRRRHAHQNIRWTVASSFREGVREDSVPRAFSLLPPIIRQPEPPPKPKRRRKRLKDTKFSGLGGSS